MADVGSGLKKALGRMMMKAMGGDLHKQYLLGSQINGTPSATASASTSKSTSSPPQLMRPPKKMTIIANSLFDADDPSYSSDDQSKDDEDDDEDLSLSFTDVCNDVRQRLLIRPSPSVFGSVGRGLQSFITRKPLKTAPKGMANFLAGVPEEDAVASKKGSSRAVPMADTAVAKLPRSTSEMTKLDFLRRQRQLAPRRGGSRGQDDDDDDDDEPCSCVRPCCGCFVSEVPCRRCFCNLQDGHCPVLWGKGSSRGPLPRSKSEGCCYLRLRTATVLQTTSTAAGRGTSLSHPSPSSSSPPSASVVRVQQKFVPIAECHCDEYEDDEVDESDCPSGEDDDEDEDDDEEECCHWSCNRGVTSCEVDNCSETNEDDEDEDDDEDDVDEDNDVDDVDQALKGSRHLYIVRPY